MAKIVRVKDEVPLKKPGSTGETQTNAHNPAIARTQLHRQVLRDIDRLAGSSNHVDQRVAVVCELYGYGSPLAGHTGTNLGNNGIYGDDLGPKSGPV
jgi:hypothetical protein